MRKTNLQYSREWAAKNPERKKEMAILYREKLKLDVISHYSMGKNRCACCGESHLEFLTLDHINLDGSKHRGKFSQLRKHGGSMSGHKFYRYLRKNKYPKRIKIQVLCFNCNCARQYSRYCPHKKNAPV